MNASFHPYTEFLTSHQQDSSSPDNFTPLLVGYRNGFSSKETCESNTTDTQSQQQLAFMDEVSNDYHNQQHILNSNSLFKICAGCREKISDRFLLFALERYWHNSCLKCHYCGAMLADVGSSCFTKEGLILCKKDYSSLYGCSGTCTGCGETIPPNEMVAKAIPGINSLDIQKPHKQIINCVFHLKCFTCAKCGSSLRPGDRYTMLGASLVCEQDWQKLLKNSPTTNGSLPTRKGKVGRPRRTKE